LEVAVVELMKHDFRYGLRTLWKNPAYAFTSILTLALGIGASTSIFSVVYGVLLRALPYNKPEQIVRMWEVDSKDHKSRFADPNFEDMRAQLRSMAGMAEMYADDTPITLGEEPERVRAAHVSKDFFSVMGVQPFQGRLFSPDEQQVGAASTALVSYSWWQSHLHATQDLEAVKLTVAKKPTAIIGVLPQGFAFPDDSQLWLARETDVRLPSRRAHNWHVVGRMRDGVSLDQTRSDASAIAQRLHQQYGPDDTDMVNAAVVPLRVALSADVRPALLVMLGVAGLLLLVACANVMNLSLAQAAARAGELGVRAALGASRARLIRQFLAEALLLSFLGSCVGVAAAYFGVAALLTMAPPTIPRLHEISVNLPVLCFTLGICLIVATGLGVLTALRSTSGNLQSKLTAGGRRQGTAGHTRRTGRMVVIAQVAITLTLLIGAGLLGRSMLRVLSINPGFETAHVLTMKMQLPDLEAATESQRIRFLDELIAGLEAVPGVQAVGGTNTLPLLSDVDGGIFVVMNSQQLRPAERDLIDRSSHTYWQHADAAFLSDLTGFLHEIFSDNSRSGHGDYVVASKGYFQALGIRLLRGRLFNDADRADRAHVAVISESVARMKWPDRDPIGQTIEFGNMDGDLRLLTIVGVVEEVRTRLEADPRPTVYVDYRQRPRTTSEFSVVMRTNADPGVMFGTARKILRQVDPAVAPSFNTFTQIFSDSLNNRRFNLLLVGVFALAALLLAVAGVFGVLAYSVSQRTREIGMRIALGATSGNVLKMVLGEGLITVMIGTAIGISASFLLTRTMRSLLYKVSPADPVTLLSVTLLLVLVAMLASWIPARRATRVDPMVALRHE
jgi:putative ABC transport system permease protein